LEGDVPLSLLGTLQGTLVNTFAIIIGAVVGVIMGGIIPKRINDISMQGIGLVVLLIGLQMALQSRHVLILIFSLVIGGIVGELLRLEEKLLELGKRIERSVGGGQSRIARAFVYSTLLYCVGAMGITGSLESGLMWRHQILYAKSAIDGVSAIIFASTMGVGVAFSALPVLFYQGSIVLLARWASFFLSETIIIELSAVGGLLIVGIGLNLLQIKNLKIGNLLPALLFNALLVYLLV
jgi:uncharacterized membrane protein YqgA involved in biofilm formation